MHVAGKNAVFGCHLGSHPVYIKHINGKQMQKSSYSKWTACMKNSQEYTYRSRDVRKPDFCICENKDADQLRGYREADQRLCFRYTDSTIPLLPVHEISSF